MSLQYKHQNEKGISAFFSNYSLADWNNYHAFCQSVVTSRSMQPHDYLSLYCQSLVRIVKCPATPKDVRAKVEKIQIATTTTSRKHFLGIATICEEKKSLQSAQDIAIVLNKRLWTENLIDFTRKRLRSEEAGNLTNKTDEAETDIFTSLKDYSGSSDDACSSDDHVGAEQDFFEEDAADDLSCVSIILSLLTENKKSKNSFDKALADFGILRLSSRSTTYEPSSTNTYIKTKLTSEQLDELRSVRELPKILGIKRIRGSSLENLMQKIDELKVDSEMDRYTKRIYDLFISGFEGKCDLKQPMQERQFTVKYVAPLFDLAFRSASDFETFWCEKGNNDLIKSHTNEHNLWDGAFCDKTPEYSESPHVGLVEVSGGTDGCSKAKLTSDLLKVAKGMQQQLKRVAMSVQGFDLNRCRRLKVVGAQIVSNHVYMQAMCCLDKNAFVMWEWADTILPRSMNDISSLHKTITSVLTFREVILSTRKLVQEMKKEEAELSENVVRDGLSSPLRPDESPWNDWFSDVKKNSRE